MRRILILAVVICVLVVAFFFVPFVPTETANFGGGPDYSGWVSPSFALFQCGVVIGQVGHEVPNGTFVNPSAQSLWDCGYPRL